MSLFCIVDNELENPVYYALTTGDATLSSGNDHVKFFDEEISPFAGFSNDYKNGFSDLYELLPPQRKILYATREWIEERKDWEMLHAIKGLQFVFDQNNAIELHTIEPVPLQIQHIDEMVELARLTKPGPFNTGTIRFGSYYGIFQNKRLVAMTGQRLHLSDHTEISAVCTHPDYLGKGYAASLLLHQLAIIRSQGKIPFLHVRDDNARAIALYERLGFSCSGVMNFYFLRKRG